MQLTLKAALAMAVVSLATATTSQAEAQTYKSMMIRLDNSPNPTGYPTNTGTSDYLSIWLKLENQLWTRFYQTTVNTIGGSIDICINFVDESLVEGVRFEIDGNDALWLDQWSTYSYSGCEFCECTGTLRQTFGIDNQMGYCLSQQASDYSDANPDVCTAYGVDYKEQDSSGQSYELLQWNY